ncbi:MAG: hypothetical protein WCB68_09415 [Pyrinomonadaceae bacterium]
MRTKLFLAAVFSILIFIVSGYLLSDAFFFTRLISRNNITTPEEAFAFVVKNTGVANPHHPPPLEYAPRKMLTTQKYLFCDQSAILMATIVGALGYETRLVDLVGDDGISHHTILEVKQNGSWKTYDLIGQTQGATYEQSARDFQNGQPYHARPVYRTYVGANWINRNNFYLQYLSLRLRGVG